MLFLGLQHISLKYEVDQKLTLQSSDTDHNMILKYQYPSKANPTQESNNKAHLKRQEVHNLMQLTTGE